jgi:hypothetical protein
MSKQKCITVITAITLFFCTLFLLNDSNEVSEVFEEVDLSLALDPFLIPTEWDLLSIKEIKEKNEPLKVIFTFGEKSEKSESLSSNVDVDTDQIKTLYEQPGKNKYANLIVEEIEPNKEIMRYSHRYAILHYGRFHDDDLFLKDMKINVVTSENDLKGMGLGYNAYFWSDGKYVYQLETTELFDERFSKEMHSTILLSLISKQ